MKKGMTWRMTWQHCDFPGCGNKIYKNIIFKIGKKKRLVRLCFTHFHQYYKEKMVSAGELYGSKILGKITLPVNNGYKEFEVVNATKLMQESFYKIKLFFTNKTLKRAEVYKKQKG